MDRCHKDLSGPHFLIPVDFLLTISCASLFLVQTTNLNSACIHGDKHTDSWFLHRDVIIDCTNVKLGVLVRLLFGPFINSGLTSSRKLFPFGPTRTPVVADARWAASPVEVPGRGCLMALFHIDTE